MDLGKAIGTAIGGKLAVGMDSRISGEMLKCAVSAGLMSTGVQVFDLGMLPTPALQYYVRARGLDGGVVITASHNPPEFNGIKCIAADGTEMAREDEERIEKIFFDRSFAVKEWDRVGSLHYRSDASNLYLDAVAGHVDRDAIRKASMTVVVDCANGAGSVTTPKLLESLGVRAITLNCNPQGTFPGRLSEPTEENLSDLIALVKKTSADLGIAHDGDADRTIFIDENGNFVHGDRSLALIARSIVRSRGGGLVVTPVSTSRCVEDVVIAAGGQIKYTKVGAPIVAREMKSTGAVFGGEENGGLIFPEHQYCRDGLMTAAKMLEVVAKEGRLSRLLDEIPQYSLIKGKVECRNEIKQDVLAEVGDLFREKKIDRTDGIKIFFDDGWVLLRPSGTEPIFRLIVEGISEAVAKRYFAEFKAALQEIIQRFND
jgi:phosphomannomutase/phosphoglucomutase